MWVSELTAAGQCTTSVAASAQAVVVLEDQVSAEAYWL